MLQSPLPSAPLAYPTFHSVGLYWKPCDGGPDNLCQVKYRRSGDQEWNEALPLWFDHYEHGESEDHSHQYRGSIVNLYPSTRYDIVLQLEATGTEARLSVETWSEELPIKEVVKLEENVSRSPLHILEGGSAVDGFVVYEPSDPGEGVIDVEDTAETCVYIDASYVILRGVTLRNASIHGIILGDVTDVVIDGCDISTWGRHDQNGFGVNLDSAIYSHSPSLERIVIQRCLLHHPRWDSNAWTEDGHPEGPQAVCFRSSQGWHVIRYNEMWSDEAHCFRDILGEYRNFSLAGFPGRDSDIYCNLLSHCWDDAIEAEGANMNVRIWSNYIDRCYMAIGGAATSLGPLYVWRNVSGLSRRGPYPTDQYHRGGAFMKMGTSDADYAQGAVYIFHNTILQPGAPWPNRPQQDFAGCEDGLIVTDSEGLQENVTSRNNILHVNNYRKVENSIKDILEHGTNSFDFDLFNGSVPATAEMHGIRLEWYEAPVYTSSNADGQYALHADSLGHDAGQRIPNFNDGFAGEGPDVGAYELDGSELRFGVEADWTLWLRQNGL